MGILNLFRGRKKKTPTSSSSGGRQRLLEALEKERPADTSTAPADAGGGVADLIDEESLDDRGKAILSGAKALLSAWSEMGAGIDANFSMISQQGRKATMIFTILLIEKYGVDFKYAEEAGVLLAGGTLYVNARIKKAARQAGTVRGTGRPPKKEPDGKPQGAQPPPPVVGPTSTPKEGKDNPLGGDRPGL